MQTETSEQLNWRKEFDIWPESKLRMFSEPSPTSIAYDSHKAFARAVLAERESAKRDAREDETLSVSKDANRIAEQALRRSTLANIWAAIAALIAAFALYESIFAGKV